MACAHCNHVHLGAQTCHESENREHLCGCKGVRGSAINLCTDKPIRKQYACQSCGHHHRTPEVCGRNLAGGKRCRCADSEGGSMAKGNGKAKDESTGKRSGSMGLLPLHVIRAAVKETEVGGECIAQIVIAGSGVEKAHELLAMVGEEVMLRTAAGGNKLRAVLNSVTVKGDDTKLEVRAKATGGRDLDAIVGMAVRIEAMQMTLRGSAKRPALGLDEADA